MLISIIAEGCYPYVVGGVSSWIQMMLNGFGEYDFNIFTIAVEESQRGDFKYEIPKNVIEIYENFLLDEAAVKERGVIPKYQINDAAEGNERKNSRPRRKKKKKRLEKS